MLKRIVAGAAAALLVSNQAHAQTAPLFSDDFATATAWQLIWGNNEIVVGNQLNLSGYTRVDAGSIWGDYSLAATVTFPAGNSTARLYFRVRDVASFYYLQIDSGGAWSLVKGKAGGAATILTRGALYIESNLAYRIKVRAEGTLLSAEISSDVSAMTLGYSFDADYLAGHIGLEGFAETAGAAVAFGKVLVLDSTQPPSSTPRNALTGLACLGSLCSVPYNVGCKGDCTCYAGGTFNSFPGSGDGCTFSISNDTYAAHWKVLKTGAEVVGTVDAGGCDPAVNYACAPGTCPFPAVADGDDGFLHQDRDFEFHITPGVDLARGQLTPDHSLLMYKNLFGRPDKGMEDIAVEWEWMNMFPLWGARIYFGSNGDLWPTGRLPLVKDGTKVGVPFRGDLIKVRGRWVLDCGHADTNGAISEIHPPVAVAWLHPSETDPHSGTIYLRMSLTYTMPPFDPFGPTFSATFPVPGSNGQNLWVGPVQSDWMVVTGATLTVCDERNGGPVGLNFGHPWAHLDYSPCPSWFDEVIYGSAPVTNGPAYQYMQSTNVGTYFRITPPVSADAAGDVTVSVDVIGIQGALGTTWGLGGSHLQVCYPSCSEARVRTYSCPGPLSGFCAPLFGWIDSVVYNNNGTLSISGWMADPGSGGTAATQGVEIYADSGYVGRLSGTFHQPRPDVVQAYQTQYPNNDFLYSGFSGTIPYARPGMHSITAKAVDLKGYSFPIGAATSVTVPCDSNHACLTGCCNAGSCVPGNSASACGSTGQVCSNCAAFGNTCQNALCVPVCPSGTMYCNCTDRCETSTMCKLHCSL